MAQQTGRGSDQFPLRFPEGMRDRLKEAAADNGRSMNAELVDRLERSFQQPAGAHYFMDAMDRDVVPRARVSARFQVAAMDQANALDVVILDADLYSRIQTCIVSGSPHDAARRAIEDAFPVEGVTWGALTEELRALDLAQAPKLAELQHLIDRRISENPALAKAIAR